MKRLFITMAAMLFATSAVTAQEEVATPGPEEMAEQAAAADPAARVPASEAETTDTSELYREQYDPDKYDEPVRWGVNPLIQQIDGDHSLGLKQND